MLKIGSAIGAIADPHNYSGKKPRIHQDSHPKLGNRSNQDIQEKLVSILNFPCLQ
jgi:hypothetical protein